MPALVSRVLGGAAALALISAPAQAAVQVFFNDLAGFNLVAGSPPIAVNFDDPSLDDVTDQTINGVTFTSPEDGQLFVVDAADTGDFTATSGGRILSPGGATLTEGPDAAQQDSVTFIFGPPVRAFGLDILFQQIDADYLPEYQVTDVEGHTIASGVINMSSSTTPGHFFIGFYSDTPLTQIATVTILDNDNGAVSPNSNLGFDTLRFGNAVPEPASWALMIGGFGFAGAALRRRRALA